MTSLAETLPRPLFDDIVHGRWLPVVGAGLSLNAIVASGPQPPDWAGLAERLRSDLADPDDAADAVDVISAFAQEHGRPALIERVAREIRIADASPGPVHESLCRLPLDVVMTTNFDSLLEEAFRRVQVPCHPVIDEMQLAISNPFPGPTLLKLHGDVSRPERMVLTEEDFDVYLLKNPLLATVTASHFAQRSVVLIGYSLSDPDLRQLLSLVRERLGLGARAIYAIEVEPSAARVARFARRHVRVVSLPGRREETGDILNRLFTELYALVGTLGRKNLIPRTHTGGLLLNDDRQREQRPGCFLSVPADGQAEYLEWLGPRAEKRSVTLVSAFDYASRGDNGLTSSLDAMIATAGGAVIETGSTWRQWEMGAAVNRLGPERVLLVLPAGGVAPADMAATKVLHKPQSSDEWAAFSDAFAEWLDETFASASTPATSTATHAPPGQEDALSHQQLVGQVMMLSARIERTLGNLLDLPVHQRSLSWAIREGSRFGILKSGDGEVLNTFRALRNDLAHGGRNDESPVQGPVDQLLLRVEKIMERIEAAAAREPGL